MSIILVLVVAALVGALINALLIWVIGKLGVGMEVDGFGPAFLTAILMAVFTVIIHFVWNLLNFSPGAGWSGFVTNLVASAAALLTAGGIVKGLRVKGFVGALVAVLGMAGVGWLVNWLIGLIF
jgi:putative membrane protein